MRLKNLKIKIIKVERFKIKNFKFTERENCLLYLLHPLLLSTIMFLSKMMYVFHWDNNI